MNSSERLTQLEPFSFLLGGGAAPKLDSRKATTSTLQGILHFPRLDGISTPLDPVGKDRFDIAERTIMEQRRCIFTRQGSIFSEPGPVITGDLRRGHRKDANANFRDHGTSRLRFKIEARSRNRDTSFFRISEVMRQLRYQIYSRMIQDKDRDISSNQIIM